MNRIRIGLTGHDPKSLKHDSVEVSSNARCLLFSTNDSVNGQVTSPLGQPFSEIAPNTVVHISAVKGQLHINGSVPKHKDTYSSIIVCPDSKNARLFVRFPKTAGKPVQEAKSYLGELVIRAQDNTVQVFIQCQLEEYVLGVLHSEIPESYHLEAIKAQTIAARTYALHPRVDHHPDNCQVCDSFLCCQCFTSNIVQAKSKYSEAVDQTKGQVITWQDSPILALFSSCGGGHTENYEDCFSDPQTNVFPPQAIPYLRGVSEKLSATLQSDKETEQTLEGLWQNKEASTVDAWSPHFKWLVRFPADAIEAHMHETIRNMLAQKDVAPFITSPESGVFGEVQSFSIDKRGVGGTGISMTITTSKGAWRFLKELVIRSVFSNPEFKVHRLNSARIYFKHEKDNQGALKTLSVYGLGFGHGVGLQQVGAEGLARLQNKNCAAIIHHYYTGIHIAQT